MDIVSTKDINQVTDLKTFLGFVCDHRLIELSLTIDAANGLLSRCPPARDAVLKFYSEFLCEYCTYYWLNKRRLTSEAIAKGGLQAPQLSFHKINSRIEYVGELSRRFHEASKLKSADQREDQPEVNYLQQKKVTPIKSEPCQSHSRNQVNSLMPSPRSPTGPASPPPSDQPMVHTIIRNIPTTPVRSHSRRTSSCASMDMDQTPKSPSLNESESNDEEFTEKPQNGPTDIFHEFETSIQKIRFLLMKFVSIDENHNNSQNEKHLHSRFRQTIKTWATDLLVSSSFKDHSLSIELSRQLAVFGGQNDNGLAPLITMWLENPVTKLLIDLLLLSHSKIEELIEKLILHDHCEWMVAHLLVRISEQPNSESHFSACMEKIINSKMAYQALFSILAYQSDNNPKAMANFPKSNILFLIHLCRQSNSLLNVLALEIPERIDPHLVNDLVRQVSTSINSVNQVQEQQQWLDNLIHCIIAAPNAFRLVLLTFDIWMDEKISAEGRNYANLILDTIVGKIQTKAIYSVNNQQLPQIDFYYPMEQLLSHMKENIEILVEKASMSKNAKEKILEIFHLLCILNGLEFASRIVFHIINLPSQNFWPMLNPLLKTLKKRFGEDVDDYISQTLDLPDAVRSDYFWQNLLTLSYLDNSISLDIEKLSLLLSEKLCSTKFNLTATAYIIKICLASLEKTLSTKKKISVRTQHRLSISLATCYFMLLKKGVKNHPESLDALKSMRECMNILSNTITAQHILCRALMDLTTENCHLFNDRHVDDFESSDLHELNGMYQVQPYNIAEENRQLPVGIKFRRLPNCSKRISKPKNLKSELSLMANNDCVEKNDKMNIIPDEDLNCYLSLQVFKSSIKDMQAFSILLVDCLTPIIFNKNIWSEDDSTKGITEQDLKILKTFELNPLLWKLCDIIGQKGYLKNCLVIIRSILSVLLALWSASSANSSCDKLKTTKKLILLLADSSLIPKLPYKYAVEVLPQLKPNEVYCVLHDIWRYLRDTNDKSTSQTNQETLKEIRPYCHRLRLLMCQYMPGPLFVKIFRELYQKNPSPFKDPDWD